MKTICLDFDGVIHSYERWKGITPTDPPTPGAREAIKKLRETFRVVVFSTRCSEQAGVDGIYRWLEKYDIQVDAVATEKPKAVLMVDDRGYRFDGDWTALLDFVANGAPEPWNRQPEPYQLRVLDEKAELDEKRAKLDTLLNMGRPEHIDLVEWNRLRRQAEAMRTYALILNERIAAFK